MEIKWCMGDSPKRKLLKIDGVAVGCIEQFSGSWGAAHFIGMTGGSNPMIMGEIQAKMWVEKEVAKLCQKYSKVLLESFLGNFVLIEDSTKVQ